MASGGEGKCLAWPLPDTTHYPWLAILRNYILVEIAPPNLTPNRSLFIRSVR